MKSLKYVVLLFAIVLIFPLIAFAEDGDEETTTAAEEDKRAIVYFFHGETCPHCQEAKSWFESIQEEYGSKFKIEAYEVWNNEENAELMQKVSEARGDDAEGVPYIICGDQSWIGFSEDSMGPEIIAQINKVYETPVAERVDALTSVGKSGTTETKKSNDALSLIIILLVVGGAGFGIYQARKTTN